MIQHEAGTTRLGLLEQVGACARDLSVVPWKTIIFAFVWNSFCLCVIGWLAIRALGLN